MIGTPTGNIILLQFQLWDRLYTIEYNETELRYDQTYLSEFLIPKTNNKWLSYIIGH